jgi:hypothetical protein
LTFLNLVRGKRVLESSAGVCAKLYRNFAGNLEAAGPGFEPGLSDSESELLFPGAYRGVRECGVNKPFILYWSRMIIYRVPPNIARVGVKVGVK